MEEYFYLLGGEEAGTFLGRASKPLLISSRFSLRDLELIFRLMLPYEELLCQIRVHFGSILGAVGLHFGSIWSILGLYRLGESL